MKAALISLGSKSSQMISNAMKNYFRVVDDIDIKDIEVSVSGGNLEVLYDGKALGDYDCIYAKGSFRYASLLRSITAALHDTYCPISPDAYTTTNNKLLTQLVLQRHNIPTPKTYISSSAGAAKKVLKKINYPIIMKFPSGTQGKGVMYADSYASASSMLDALAALKQPFLIQEYIETGGADIRAVVVNSRVVASIKRKAMKGEKRANIHVGGKGTVYEPDAYTKKIAILAAKAVGAEICAVDILESIKGPMVIEVNFSPGLQGITAATKVNVADKIAKYLFDQTKSSKESGKKVETTKIFEELGIAKQKQAAKELLMNLDFRGDRVLLPEIVTKATGFSEKDEFSVKVEKGKVVIENIGGK